MVADTVYRVANERRTILHCLTIDAVADSSVIASKNGIAEIVGTGIVVITIE